MNTIMTLALDVPGTVELELTDKCQMSCGHCLSDSGPTVPHGAMTLDDWKAVIGECAELGVKVVQLIGGEPTTFPGWADLVDHALSHGLGVEVFSNLFHVTDKGWAVFSKPGVRLATSYYSVNSGEHDKVTNKPGSHEKTRTNIVKAVRLGIPIRAGVVRCHDGQLEKLAVDELRALGVETVTLDNARAVGRGSGGTAPTMDALCGRCALGRLAVLPDGAVVPCVLGRFLPTGNVQDPGGLRSVLTGPRWAEITASIPRKAAMGCPPNDSNDCNPANTEACAPKYELVPVSLGGCPPNDSNDCNPANTEACAPKF